VLSLVPDEPDWDVPHRLLAAAEYLRLTGAAGDDPLAAMREHPSFVAAFVREHTVQTNVVQRCWALLPLFLSAAARSGRPLELLELGTSAGLNLYWDRYRYEYAAGGWGRAGAALTLRGDERCAVPASLLDVEVEIRRRRGVDLRPLDVDREDDLLLLLSFSLDSGYRERARLAASVLRKEPPELVWGDYVAMLPDLLADRDTGATTVVFQTISTIYLPLEQRRRVREAVEAADDVVWISTPTPEEHGFRGRQYPLELDGRIVAEMDNGGTWLEWWG
jgi:hypothetical protein